MFKSAVVVTLLVLAMATGDEGILTLKDSDFPQILEDHPFLFIKFHTPWCTHCKKLAPIFTELAASLKLSHPQRTSQITQCNSQKWTWRSTRKLVLSTE